MPSLRKDLREKLEKTVLAARVAAEAGAREALAALGVDQGKAFEHLKPAEKALRNQLRARGRQAGDLLDDRSGKQTIDHLVQMVGYEHWHRMLFARFLAENGLLLEPDNQVAVSLSDVDELARDAKVDIWELAGRFAQRMLPAVFRADDPVLALTFARETRTKLEKLVADLPNEVFLADDSLGWTYQFWQTQQKKIVNEAMKAGLKVGADELSPVTQLFTEDYMVDFLLHNTLGAWWAGKLGPINATSEDAARAQAELPAKNALPAITWTYLRFVKDEATQTWTPAAGTFPGWPKEAKNITFLDPSMGSGHFVVFALPILARLRMEEENLDATDAVTVVLRDNIHGLELDERCTQIAAFNLALTAWKLAGYQSLPGLHLACSGLAPNASEAAWVTLAGSNLAAQNGMVQLYRLFKNAPVLGSLINPRVVRDELLNATFNELQPLFEKALAQEAEDGTEHEMAVTARGVAKAAEILAGQFTLVATNVPYLVSGKQGDTLKNFIEANHYSGRSDLATAFVLRSIDLCREGGTAALVTPQNWLFLGSYRSLREELLANSMWQVIARLGAGAFETITGEVVNVSLVSISRKLPHETHSILGIDASDKDSLAEKSHALGADSFARLSQIDQLRNPDARILFEGSGSLKLLSNYVVCHQGLATGDLPRFGTCFWEVPQFSSAWIPWQGTVENTCEYGGRSGALLWEDGLGQLHAFNEAHKAVRKNTHLRGVHVIGKRAVAITQMGRLAATLYGGERYDDNLTVLMPNNPAHLPALWAFCSSEQYREIVRQRDQSLKVPANTLAKVPFDLEHWQKVAEEKSPNGLAKPFSSDPTQWLFNGHPKGADWPLQVGVARLLGYQWPRQTGSSFADCPALGPDGLESHADSDGIVCLSAVRGERTGVDRLRTLLSASLGRFDEHGLIAATDSKATSLETWLRDDFFAQHCGLFLTRPFIWHIWDGRPDGFHALLNYHKLAAHGGAGRKLLELLTFAYLGDWLKKQRDEQKKPGAEERLIAAETLQQELKAILAGEPPYDIFVRWKPLHQQSIGWDPDINDGVRLNIRPFLSTKDVARKGAGILRFKPGIKWDKDRGNEPARPKSDFPWFWGWDKTTTDFTGGPDFDGNRWNDCHYTTASKRAARERHNK